MLGLQQNVATPVEAMLALCALYARTRAWTVYGEACCLSLAFLEADLLIVFPRPFIGKTNRIVLCITVDTVRCKMTCTRSCLLLYTPRLHLSFRGTHCRSSKIDHRGKRGRTNYPNYP